MSTANAIRILDLQAQDKIVRFEPSPCRDGQGAESTYYVSSVDYEREVVHALSFSGNSYPIKFVEITDIIKAEAPVMVLIPCATWTAHGCDPAWLGKPVRAVAMTVYQGRITGVAVPKWPGAERGMLTLSAGAGDSMLPNVTEDDLVRSLPANGWNPKRFGDGAAARNRDYRTAGNRVAKFISSAVASATGVVPPMDISVCKARAASQRAAA